MVRLRFPCHLRLNRYSTVMLTFYTTCFSIILFIWATQMLMPINISGFLNTSSPDIAQTLDTLKKRVHILAPQPTAPLLGRIPKHIEPLLTVWDKTIATQCDGCFVGYNNTFAALRDVTVNPRFGSGRFGGENISSVMHQLEKNEYMQLNPGYFQLNCSANVKYSFDKSHLNDWLKATSTKLAKDMDHKTMSSRWTIFVQRYEYANLYHTMTDIYNAFLMIVHFQLSPTEVDIVWVDGHPIGALDSVWSTLFGKVIRAGSLKEPVFYHNMIWNIVGYSSPLSRFKSPASVAPYLEQFRAFFLHSYSLSPSRVLNCNQLTVLFIWRHDYIAHPRNPSGHVARKIKNEEELLAEVRNLLPGHNVSGVQIDTLSMKEQLQLVSQADILIGMHGAGLTHVLFTPAHGGLIELFPNYYGKGNTHFRTICSWRGVKYLWWENKDPALEHSGDYTTIPPGELKAKVTDMKSKMCKASSP